MEKDLDWVQGFHRVPREERLKRLSKLCNLTPEEAGLLSGKTAVSPDIAENLIENVIGYFPIPMGIATNFRIDGQDIPIPMAVEETSIIAAASATAKWIKSSGLITTYMKGRLIIGQIQIPEVRDPAESCRRLIAERDRLIQYGNECLVNLVRRGGGIRDLSVRTISVDDSLYRGEMLVIHVLCDPCDAMGANLINQACEFLKPLVEEITQERVGLCILSNLMDQRIAGAEVRIRNVDPELGDGIQSASHFADLDPYRACTHNKGVLNGIDPILIATGNDWRAVEAGIHAYAARDGHYKPVTQWRMVGSDLVGRFEAPIAVGVVGGVTAVHPIAKIALKILGAPSADQLARICGAVGLVQNLGALKALSTVGIVKGHMQLHAANLAIAAGADLHEVAEVKERLVVALRKYKHIGLTQAKEILESIRIQARNTAAF